MSTKITIEVYETRDYETLKTNKLQPQARMKGVKATLKNSIKATNGNKYMPILINADTMEIIDGHNRLRACVATNTPVFYILVNSKDDAQMMINLNTSSKQWSTLNYIAHHAISLPQYKKLDTFLQLEGAGFELVRLFSGINIDGVKAGVNLKGLDYSRLEDARKAGAVIGGILSIKNTAVIRAIRRLEKREKTLNLKVLIKKFEKANNDGKFEFTSIATVGEQIDNLLTRVYSK